VGGKEGGMGGRGGRESVVDTHETIQHSKVRLFLPPFASHHRSSLPPFLPPSLPTWSRPMTTSAMPSLALTSGRR